MALRYSGNGDTYGAQVVVYGDGVSTSVAIDLSKPPFSIDFTGGQPSSVYEATAVNEGRTLSLVGSVLTITFNVAPPTVSFAPTRGGIPNTPLSPRFVYG